jgi:hypothetical protein
MFPLCVFVFASSIAKMHLFFFLHFICSSLLIYVFLVTQDLWLQLLKLGSTNDPQLEPMKIKLITMKVLHLHNQRSLVSFQKREFHEYRVRRTPLATILWLIPYWKHEIRFHWICTFLATILCTNSSLLKFYKCKVHNLDRYLR